MDSWIMDIHIKAVVNSKEARKRSILKKISSTEKNNLEKIEKLKLELLKLDNNQLRLFY